MDSPRVALVSEEFPPFMFGGISTVCYDLARSLSKKKIPTTVYCGRSSKPTIETVSDYLEVVRLPCLDFPPRFLWFQVQNYLTLASHLRNTGIIHAVNPQVSLMCVYLKKRLGKPLVSSFHGVPDYDLKAFIGSPTSSWTIGDFGYQIFEYPLNDYFTRLSLVNSDKIISCSKTTLNELSTVYRKMDFENSLVIQNGIDFEKIQKLEESFGKGQNEGELTLIYYGRLYWHKGITYLIKAFEFLAHDYPDLRLKIFGTGPLENKIKELVSKLGLEDKVTVFGYLRSHSDLLKEIIKADIAVLPSLREAQSMSALEAMAFKKPVVAFDFPFAREIIRNNYNGALARPKDPKDLADKIGVLLSDGGLRNRVSQNAYEYVQQNHNIDSLVDKYIEVYREMSDFA